MAVRQTGISLVELMIAMTIGLIMIGGAFTIFIQVKRSYNENEKLMYMQDDARFALSELTRDIASAGFFGELSDPASLGTDTSLTISQDCGPPATAWAYDVTTQIETLDNTNGATAATQYSCIDPGAFQDGTDVLAVKRTIGSISTPPLSAGQVYVKSNGVVALLFQHPEDVPSAVPVPLP
ncbi:MAG: prepilin-type N-terminal cleavage/methylation domain-containing protein, partial [Gammaproteobacteria bacterium]|nr:prepilin-type N-terminal cleavage/methylation domain-containing protein [Gammaproteobacteria bacterium]